MATLVFSGIGTMLGGPIGGAIGSLVGRQLDAALFGPPARQGPRLKELAFTTSTYGQVLPRHYGRMRTGGSVIWATELVEHSEAQGGGKGAPSITTYSYTANFAAALSSRPILGIGRIWADGKLLRGAAGDLKVGGALRVHTGAGDQMPDPLIASAEGEHRCPAYRGIAYVVFENLDLSEFYNRIPSITFEVIADEQFDLAAIIGDRFTDVDDGVSLPGIAGYTSESSPADDLGVFDQVIPLALDCSGERLMVHLQSAQREVIPLSQPAIATADDDFGGASGFVHHRAPPSEQPPAILRYYDVARDYQPSLQRVPGNAATGTIDLPAALDANTARSLIERTSRRTDWSRERIAWRTSELDYRVKPGSLVSLPDIDGVWRVREWEWRDKGVELALQRVARTSADRAASVVSDPGRGNPPVDAPLGETRLLAFELPLEAESQSPDRPRLVAAVSSSSPHWKGAALYADRGDGQLHPLGPSGRRRATMGIAQSILPAASPLLFDRGSTLTVRLIDPAMHLAAADTQQLAQGENLALIGDEIVQFLSAIPVGGGLWQLAGLLRGRGGTELAIGNHGPDEPFVLLDRSLVAIEPMVVEAASDRAVVALGLGDAGPVRTAIGLSGLTLRPLAPVHPRRIVSADGAWNLSWTRRGRGGWSWHDAIDVPMVEQTERYLVTLGPIDAPIAAWTTNEPMLRLSAAELADLNSTAPHAQLHVRQQGTHAMSHPLLLCTLP